MKHFTAKYTTSLYLLAYDEKGKLEPCNLYRIQNTYKFKAETLKSAEEIAELRKIEINTSLHPIRNSSTTLDSLIKDI